MVSYDLGDTKAWDYQIQVNQASAERMDRIEDKLDKTNGKLTSLTILVIISLLINITEFPTVIPIIKSIISFIISL